MKMNESGKIKHLVTLVFSLYVASELIVFAAAGKSPSSASLKVGSIDPAVIVPAEQLSSAYTMVANHVKPAVVTVYSEKNIAFTQPEFQVPFDDDFMRQFFGGQLPHAAAPRQFRSRQHGMGSGMILDQQGHILTNYHVVRDVDDIKVQLADGRKFEARVVGADSQSDVAIIQFKGSVPNDLPIVSLGDSDALQVGSLVEAIGAPFGLQQTVTKGIISAMGRSDVGIAAYEDFLQTDASINPGNSGGPLVDMHGEVIGMNSAIATHMGQFAGVGFAIPSNMIKTMLPKLIKGEKIIRGQLGVIIQNMTTDLAKEFNLTKAEGVIVSQVIKNSPAAKAGIMDGDVVMRYDDQAATSVQQLRSLVANTLSGTKVKIEIMRNGKAETLTATIGSQTAESLASAPMEDGASLLTKLGLTLQTLNPDSAKQLGVKVEKGVAITDVNETSLASLAGLQKGDVIVEADHQPVMSVDELEQVLIRAENKNQVLLRIMRREGSLFVVLQIK